MVLFEHDGFGARPTAVRQNGHRPPSPPSSRMTRAVGAVGIERLTRAPSRQRTRRLGLDVRYTSFPRLHESRRDNCGIRFRAPRCRSRRTQRSETSCPEESRRPATIPCGAPRSWKVVSTTVVPFDGVALQRRFGGLGIVDKLADERLYRTGTSTSNARGFGDERRAHLAPCGAPRPRQGPSHRGADRRTALPGGRRRLARCLGDSRGEPRRGAGAQRGPPSWTSR